MLKGFFQTYKRTQMMIFVTILFFLGMGVWFIMLYRGCSGWKQFDPYSAIPAGKEVSFSIDSACEYEDGYFRISGWSLVNGEPIETVDQHLLAQDLQTGVFYLLPTSPTMRYDVALALTGEETGMGYEHSGLVSVLRKKDLDRPYRLYILNCNNENNLLIDTGAVLDPADYGL